MRQGGAPAARATAVSPSPPGSVKKQPPTSADSHTSGKASASGGASSLAAKDSDPLPALQGRLARSSLSADSLRATTVSNPSAATSSTPPSGDTFSSPGVSKIDNRFIVMCLMEDLLGSTTAETPEECTRARSRAIAHIPALAATMGAIWATREVVPFLLTCVSEDVDEVSTAIARILRWLVPFPSIPLCSTAIRRTAEGPPTPPPLREQEQEDEDEPGTLLDVVSALLASRHAEVRNTATRATVEVLTAIADRQRQTSHVVDDNDCAFLSDLCADLSLGFAHQRAAVLQVICAVLVATVRAPEARAPASALNDDVPLVHVDAFLAGLLPVHPGAAFAWGDNRRVTTEQEGVRVSPAAWRCALTLIYPALQRAARDPALEVQMAMCRSVPFLWAASSRAGNGPLATGCPARETMGAIVVALRRAATSVLVEQCVSFLSPRPAERPATHGSDRPQPARVGRRPVPAPPVLTELALLTVSATVAVWCAMGVVPGAADVVASKQNGSLLLPGETYERTRRQEDLTRLQKAVVKVAGDTDWRKRVVAARHVGLLTLVTRAALQAQTAGVAPQPLETLRKRCEGISGALQRAVQVLSIDAEPEVRTALSEHLASTVGLGLRPLTAGGSSSSPQDDWCALGPVPTAAATVIDACQQLVLDEAVGVRTHVVSCLGKLCTEARQWLGPETVRSTVFPMLLDLLNDDAAPVRLAAVSVLCHCVAAVGRSVVEHDLIDAASRLLDCPQWRVREAFANALPQIVEAMCVVLPTSDTMAMANPAAVVEPSARGDDIIVTGMVSPPLPTTRALLTPGTDERRFFELGLLPLIARVLYDRVYHVRSVTIGALLKTVAMIRNLDNCADYHLVGSTNGSLDAFVAVVWNAVSTHPRAKSQYLFRTTTLDAMVALGIPVAAARAALIDASKDPVPNVRAAVARILRLVLSVSQPDQREEDYGIGQGSGATPPWIAVQHLGVEMPAPPSLQKLLDDGKRPDVVEKVVSGSAGDLLRRTLRQHFTLLEADRCSWVLDVARSLIGDPDPDVRHAASLLMTYCH